MILYHMNINIIFFGEMGGGGELYSARFGELISNFLSKFTMKPYILSMNFFTFNQKIFT